MGLILSESSNTPAYVVVTLRTGVVRKPLNQRLHDDMDFVDFVDVACFIWDDFRLLDKPLSVEVTIVFGNEHIWTGVVPTDCLSLESHQELHLYIPELVYKKHSATGSFEPIITWLKENNKPFSEGIKLPGGMQFMSNKDRAAFLKRQAAQNTEKDFLLQDMKETFDRCLQIATRKNSDYGATAKSPYHNFTNAKAVGVSVERGILVRMMDKISRVSTLLDKEAKVKEESINDTLEDLINYAAILKSYINRTEA